MRAELGRTPFAVADVETTGLSPWLGDRIVEIAVIRLHPTQGIVGQYTTLVNPERPMGATSVHLIEDRDVQAAPRFGEIAGDLAAQLQDSIVVGHNVRYDLSFIGTEFGRLGVRMPQPPTICTLELGTKLYPKMPARRLFHCCTMAGINVEDWHTSLCDATATGHLLSFYLVMAMTRGLRSLEALGCLTTELRSGWCGVPPTGVALPRTAAVVAREAERGYLARVVERLPEIAVEGAADAGYLDLLDKALADRELTIEEVGELARFAVEWGMTREQVMGAHRRYLAALVQGALADSIVTATERAELENACDVLGLHRAALAVLLEAAEEGEPS